MWKEKNLMQSNQLAEKDGINNTYYEAIKKLEKEKKQKRRKGCSVTFITVIAVLILINSISNALSQKAYRDAVTIALEDKTYTAELLTEYLTNTKDSENKKAKNCYKWGKLAFENDFTEDAFSLFKVSTSKDKDYNEKVMEYFSEFIEENQNDTQKCLETIKLFEENGFTIEQEIKDLFKYKSIKAVFVSEDSPPGYSIHNFDFEVFGVFSDGTEVKLNTDEYEIVGAKEYGINTTQTIKIKDKENGYETSVKVNCPKEMFFDDFTRSEFCNEFYKRMKENGVTGYKMELEKNDKGIITQAAFYKVIGGFRAYCYLLDFLNNDTQNYVQVDICTNGNKYSYNEMQTLREILIAMTFGDKASGKIINDLLGTNDSRTEAGIRYTAYSYSSSGTIDYTLSASIKPDYVTSAD